MMVAAQVQVLFIIAYQLYDANQYGFLADKVAATTPSLNAALCYQ